jgi:hypothetical protein
VGAINCPIPWAFVLIVILESYGTALPQSRPAYLAPSLIKAPPTTYAQHQVTQKPHFSMNNDTAMAGLPMGTVLPFEEEDWVRMRHFFHFLGTALIRTYTRHHYQGLPTQTVARLALLRRTCLCEPSHNTGLTLRSHKELRQLVSEIRATLQLQFTITIHRAL